MSAIVPGYNSDCFISYRQKDNKHYGWGRRSNRYSVIGNQFIPTQHPVPSTQQVCQA